MSDNYDKAIEILAAIRDKGLDITMIEQMLSDFKGEIRLKTVETFEMPGVKLRDLFALAALAGMHARDSFDAGQASPEQRAKLAYIDADACMRERG